VSQAWPNVLEAVKAKGRVAWLLIGNASVVSLNEGQLTLRFPRQGDVKGFQSSRYEDLLKQVLNGMFGINVVVRAISGTETPPAGRSGPGPVPQPPPPPAPSSAATSAPMPGASTAAGNTASAGDTVLAGDTASAGDTGPAAEPAASSGQVPPQPVQQGPGAPGSVSAPAPSAPPVGSAGNGSGGATRSLGGSDLPPPPDDDYFDPDDEDNMSVSTVTELTGMALVQRELGGQIIGEYES
jgi:DNA polymerase-3 subunit gamma/tau